MAVITIAEYTLSEIHVRITSLTKHKYTFFMIGEMLDKAERVIYKFQNASSLEMKKVIYQEFCDTYDEYVPCLLNRYSYAIMLMSDARELMKLEIEEVE